MILFLLALSTLTASARTRRRLTLDLRKRIKKIEILFPKELSFQAHDVEKDSNMFACDPFTDRETVLWHKRYKPKEYDWIMIAHLLQWESIKIFDDPTPKDLRDNSLTLVYKKKKWVGDPGFVYKYIQKFKAGTFIKIYSVFGNENQADILAAAYPKDFEKRWVAESIERILHSARRTNVRWDVQD